MSRWKQETAEERFWKFVQKSAGCWFWTGGRNEEGYGLFCLVGECKIRRYIRASRFSYQQKWGHIPSHLQVHHVCRNTSCVNPDHLTALDVHAHAREGKFANLTHCKRGHEYNEQNTYYNPSKGGTHRTCRECMKLHRQKWLRKTADA